MDFAKPHDSFPKYENPPLIDDNFDVPEQTESLCSDTIATNSWFPPPQFIYPYTRKRVGWDAYGEDIDQNDFISLAKTSNKQVSYKSENIVHALDNMKCKFCSKSRSCAYSSLLPPRRDRNGNKV